MTLKETILKYADILNENITAKQAGASIINLYNKHYSDEEIIKRLETLTKGEWFHITGKDTYYISVIPFNWKPSDGGITDCMIDRHNENEAAKIRDIMNKWVLAKAKELKTENPKAHCYFVDRSTGEERKLF